MHARGVPRDAAAKTGALLSCASAIGAVLAGGAAETVVASGRVRRPASGIAFQAVDDLLGIWGEPELTGKPTWSDLRQRKSSLPVVAALDVQADDGRRLRALLSQPELSEAELADAAALVEHGGRTRLGGRGGRAAARARAAPSSSARASTPSAREELEALARFIVDAGMF